MKLSLRPRHNTTPRPSPCSLEPMPRALVKVCLPSLCPIMVDIMNSTLGSGIVPFSFEMTAVTHFIKKASCTVSHKLCRRKSLLHRFPHPLPLPPISNGLCSDRFSPSVPTGPKSTKACPKALCLDPSPIPFRCSPLVRNAFISALNHPLSSHHSPLSTAYIKYQKWKLLKVNSNRRELVVVAPKALIWKIGGILPIPVKSATWVSSHSGQIKSITKSAV